MHGIVDPLAGLATSVDVLRPMRGNPRVGDVEAVKRSLEAFGQRKPIVAQTDGTIIAGHHLHAAAVALGWSEVAVVFVDDDEAMARAFNLADNRTGDLGRYDNDLLAQSLVELRDADHDLLLASSYTDDDVDALLAFLEGQHVPSGDDDEPDGDGDGEARCPACGFVLT